MGEMNDFIRWIAISENQIARRARRLRRAFLSFSLPAPVLIVRPLLIVFLAIRKSYYFLVRIFVCEPLFKAYCTQYGRGVRTGPFIHWFNGRGRLIVGDNVLVDGKCSFSFALRYATDPVLSIGSNTIISHACGFTVGRRITIGEHCLIARGVLMFDAPGHPTSPALRKMGAPANLEDVRAIEICNNAWIGTNAIIFPGVTVGEGSVVAAGSAVMSDVPPFTTVAGNPARVIGRLSPGEVPKGGRNAQTAGSAANHSGRSLNDLMPILRKTLGTDSLTPDEDFYDAGITSIMVLPLIAEIEEHFGVVISDNDFQNANTGREVAAYIETLLADSHANPASKKPCRQISAEGGPVPCDRP